MNEPDEHEQVVELLKRAQRPEAEVTPEHLEENLRWLVRATRPEAKASEALRERVRAIAAGRRVRPPSLFDRLFSGRSSGRSRALLGAFPLAIACIVLFLLFATRARAQMLARTLRAMAQVRSAHCVGWRVEYRGRGEGRQPVPERMRVEWWYKAPNWYRKNMEPEVPGEGMPASQLIVKGRRSVVVTRLRATSQAPFPVPPPALSRYLSPLDFFSQQGFLHRAEDEQAARVTSHEGKCGDRLVQIIEVEAPEPQAGKMCRKTWVLYVDPASDLVLRSESRFDVKTHDGAWQPMEEETLDRLDYNVRVKDSLFEVKLPTGPHRSHSV
jgi:hypothetical protein